MTHKSTPQIIAASLTASVLLLVALAGCGSGGDKNNTSNPSATPTPSASTSASPVASPSGTASPSPSPTPITAPSATPFPVLTGQDALQSDWTTDAPGIRRKITVADLPGPFSTDSASNGAEIVARPDGAWPKAPDGFVVEQYKTDLTNPRVLVTAPNGDVFVAESGANRISVLRGATADGKAAQSQVFVSGLNQPFGIAFFPVGPNPEWVYVANTDGVVRFPYHSGDMSASGGAQTVVDSIPGGGKLPGGGHWTRDLAFSNDNQTMWVSIGSKSNLDENNDPEEAKRALIYAFSPDGTNGRIFASGLRNPVGLAVNPDTGQLWTAVNERDGLGDNLVPDYVTHVEENGFYGWPWYYMGGIQDPRKTDAHPDLRAQTRVPDVLLQSHSASLDLTFYNGAQFPAEYRGQLFVASHGSWNRARRTGYKVIRVPISGGRATGEYEDFLTGFVVDNQKAWGRPVGVTVGNDGALLVSDDGGNCVWRVSYAPGRAKRVPTSAIKKQTI